MVKDVNKLRRELGNMGRAEAQARSDRGKWRRLPWAQEVVDIWLYEQTLADEAEMRRERAEVLDLQRKATALAEADTYSRRRQGSLVLMFTALGAIGAWLAIL